MAENRFAKYLTAAPSLAAPAAPETVGNFAVGTDVRAPISQGNRFAKFLRQPEPVVGVAESGRLAVGNPDGSISTERSVTVTDPRINGGAATNIPSMYRGTQYSDERAADEIAAAGGIDPETRRALPGFDSIDAAVAAAQARSDGLGDRLRYVAGSEPSQPDVGRFIDMARTTSPGQADPRMAQAFQGVPPSMVPERVPRQMAPEPTAPEDMGQVEKGFRSGVEGMKGTVSAFRSILQAGRLNTEANMLAAMDRIDRGERVPVTPYTPAPVVVYQEGDKRARKVVEDRLAGDQEFRRALLDDWRRYSQEAEKFQGRVPNATDIKDFGGFLDWAGYSAGQVAPSIATMMMTTIAGGLVAGPAGTIAGAAVPGYVLGAGDVQSGLLEKGIDRPGVAAAAGVPMAALEAAGGVPGRIARSFFTKPVVEGLAQSFVRRLAKEAPRSMREEAMTEGLQQAWQTAVESGMSGEEFWTEANVLKVLNAMAVGAVGGAAGAPVSAAMTGSGPAAVSPPLPAQQPAGQPAMPQTQVPGAQPGAAAPAAAAAPGPGPSVPSEPVPAPTYAAGDRVRINDVGGNLDGARGVVIEAGPNAVLIESHGQQFRVGRNLLAPLGEADMPPTPVARPEVVPPEMPQPAGRPEAEQAAAAPTAPVSADQAPPAAATTFKTAKGSSYVVHEDGTTTRDKAARPEHPGDSGLKQRSAVTVYADRDTARALNPGGMDGGWRLMPEPDGSVSMLTKADGGDWGYSPSSKRLKVSTTPAVGLQPIEMWKPETLRGRQVYRGAHIGNAITEIGSSPVSTTPPAPNLEPVYAETDDGGIDESRQIGWTDPATRDFRPLEPREAPAAPQVAPGPAPAAQGAPQVESAPTIAPAPAQAQPRGRQPARSGAEREFAEMTRVPARPKTLTQFIRDRGGIDPADPNVADLRAILDTGAFRLLTSPARARTGKGGIGIDYIREAAVEYGFLPEGATINDLLDAIRQDVAGDGVYGEGRRIFSEEDRTAATGYIEAVDRRQDAERYFADADLKRFPSLDVARSYIESRADLGSAIEEMEARVDMLERAAIMAEEDYRDGPADDLDIPFDFGTEPGREGDAFPAPARGAEAAEAGRAVAQGTGSAGRGNPDPGSRDAGAAQTARRRLTLPTPTTIEEARRAYFTLADELRAMEAQLEAPDAATNGPRRPPAERPAPEHRVEPAGDDGARGVAGVRRAEAAGTGGEPAAGERAAARSAGPDDRDGAPDAEPRRADDRDEPGVGAAARSRRVDYPVLDEEGLHPIVKHMNVARRWYNKLTDEQYARLDERFGPDSTYQFPESIGTHMFESDFPRMIDMWQGFLDGNQEREDAGAAGRPWAAPETEMTDQGEQILTPGVKPVTDRDRAEAKGAKPLRSDKRQKAADDGLFDVAGRGQGDLLDGPKYSRPINRRGATTDVGGVELPLNQDGTVTLYHGTTRAAAKRIVADRRLVSGGEPSVYLSTAPGGTGYGDGTVVAVDVDPADLRIDDGFPDGRVDFAIDRRRVSVAAARVAENDDPQIKFRRADDSPAILASEKAVLALLRRIAPSADVLTTHRMEDEGGAPVYGRYLRGMIAIAMEAPDALGTARHEAIHYLRAAGHISPDEWRVLVAAARKQGWLRKHKIRTRYPDLSTEAQLEEAVAEAYPEWAAGRLGEVRAVDRAFRKIRDVLDKVVAAIREALGFDPTWETVFGRVESGEQATRSGVAVGDGDEKAQRPQTDPAEVAALEKALIDEFGLRSLALSVRGGDLKLGMIAVPADRQGQGIGTQAMRRIIEFADGAGLRIVLTAGQRGDGTGTTSQDRLKRFYKRLGFVENKGRNKDLAISEGMYREPGGGAKYSRPSDPQQLGQLEIVVPSQTVYDTLLDANRSLTERLKATVSRETIAASLERARGLLQDRFVRVKATQAAIEKLTGKPLSEAENVYLREELYSGRAGDRLDEIARTHKDPLVKAVVRSSLNGRTIQIPDGKGGTMDATGGDILEAYLYARHAPERNAQIAKINPDFAEGGGSGMTDADAAEVMKIIRDADLMPETESLAAKVDDLLAEGVARRVEYGLMSAQDAAKWRDTYKHYAPLRGMSELEGDEDVARPRAGKGYSVRGAESKRALGRESRASDILASAFVQADEAVIRGEKNRVFQALHNLVSNHPDPDLWEINRQKMAYVISRKTGLVEHRPVNALTAAEEAHTVRGKIAGQEVRIMIHDPHLAAAIKTVGADQMGPLLAALARVNRYLSSINTGLNPEFVITNALRDLQAAGVNLQQHDLKGITRDVLANYRRALAGAYGGTQGKRSTEWQKIYGEYSAAGGKVSFWRMDDINDHRRAFAEAVADADPSSLRKLKKAGEGVLDWIENLNVAVDNGIRLAAFEAARKRGLSDEKAASLAKNLTVNFNRRGRIGPAMNALYMFYNAGIQGTAVLVGAMRSSRVRKVVAGIAVAGFLAEMLNAALSPEDDDGELVYDKIGGSRDSADFLKSRNMVFVDPTGTFKDGYVTIPLPYGYNVFWDFGRNMAAYARGAQTGAKALGNAMRTAVDMFNPIGTGMDWVSTILPTLVKPAYELTANKNFMGGRVYPEPSDFDKSPAPYSAQPYNSTSTVSKEVAAWLNEATGGDRIKPGAIDVPPQAIDHLGGWAFGAAGRFWGGLTDVTARAGRAAVTGEPFEWSTYDIPFVRKVVRPMSEFRDRRDAYDAIGAIKEAQGYYRDYVKAGEIDKARDFRAENDPLLRLYKLANKTQRDLSALRKERYALDGKAPADDPRIERNKAAEARLLLDFAGRYRDAKRQMAADRSALTSTEARAEAFRRNVRQPAREALGATP